MSTDSVPTFRPSPETFLVEEIPAYLPAGAGEHTFLWIEKRSLTTFDAINQLARRLGVESRDIGYAGMKDRHATTRQWLSIARVAPELALAAGDHQLRVLRAELHGNKLRVGHLHGNRFETVISGLPAAAAPADVIAIGAATATATAVAPQPPLRGDDDPVDGEELVRRLTLLASEGLPNRYGDQRFGVRADNAVRGLAVLRGQQREPDHRRRRLLLSAVQSAVFNQVLALREAAGLLRQVVGGDVLQKSDSGGVFVTEDLETDQLRVLAGEIVITGPMPGGWAREPPPGTPARSIEDEALAMVGATREEFASVGRDLPGARRPLLAQVILDQPVVIPHRGDGHSIRVGFQLPAGTYATVLLEALGVTVHTRDA